MITEVLFGDVKTSHCCNLFHEAIYFVDTHWLNGVPDVRLGLAWRGAASKISEEFADSIATLPLQSQDQPCAFSCPNPALKVQ